MDTRVLGVDVGGVIIERAERASDRRGSPKGDRAIDRTADDSDTSFFSKNYLRTPAVEGAFQTLRRLSEGFASIHLVSKCGEHVEAKTKKWLAHNGFHTTTGIAPERVHFCRARRDKAGICEHLGITHFIDDRLEVLGYLTTVPHRFLFRPVEDEVQANATHLANVIRVDSWPEILERL